MANLDIEQTRNQARALLDSRIESVTQLVKARQRVADLKEQLAEAERDDKRAYVRATKDGWSAEELKKLGLEPGAVARRRKTSAQRPQVRRPLPRMVTSWTPPPHSPERAAGSFPMVQAGAPGTPGVRAGFLQPRTTKNTRKRVHHTTEWPSPFGAAVSDPVVRLCRCRAGRCACCPSKGMPGGSGGPGRGVRGRCCGRCSPGP